MAKERINSMNYLLVSIQNDIEKLGKQAIATGVEHRRWFLNYECLAVTSSFAKAKLAIVYVNYPAEMKSLIEKNAKVTFPFLALSDYIQTYLKELYEAKKKEITNTKDPIVIKKILEQFSEDIRVIDQLLTNLESTIYQHSFSFFENFVNASYKKETAMREIPTQDLPNISNCM